MQFVLSSFFNSEKKFLTVVIVVYGLIQLIYILFFSLPFVSDSFNYYQFAQSAIQENTYYPNPSSIYSTWLVAPVYINYSIILLKISSSQTIILFSNVFLNSLQMVVLFMVTRQLFNTRAAHYSIVIYVLYLNNLGLVLLNLTELMFGILILLSIYFYNKNSSAKDDLLCGLLVGLAIGVRPTGWALVLMFFIIYLLKLFKGEVKHQKIALIMLGVVLYILPMGWLSMKNIDRFEYTSTTGPANLIMSANPGANGVYDNEFFLTDSLYLTKRTYYERNEYMREEAINYIKSNFDHWLLLIPRKVYSTFISDNWAIEPLIHSDYWNLNNYLKATGAKLHEFENKNLLFKMGFWILNIWQLFIYGLIITLFLIQSYLLIQRKLQIEHLLVLGFVIIGMGMTIAGSVGNPRYKYNFLIVGIALISPLVVRIFESMRKAINS